MNSYQISRCFTLILAIGIACMPNLVADVIDVTDKKGRSINAELESYDGTNVDIRRTSDRRKFSIAVADLNDETQTAIKEWLAKGGNLIKAYEVDVNTGKTTKRTSSYSDTKVLRLSPTISIKNPDIVKDSRPAYITILMLGRPTEERGQIHVFKKQSFEVPKLAPLKSTSFRVDPIATEYSDDSDYGYGERYHGYIWIIHNKNATEVYAAKSIPSPYGEKFARNFLKLKEDVTYFEDTFRPVPSTRY